MAKKKVVVVAPNPVEILEKKLKRIKELRELLAKNHALFAEHDALVEEVLPLFITTTPDGFLVRREVKLGGGTYTFTPHFYDAKKGALVAKTWKSCAFEVGRIA